MRIAYVEDNPTNLALVERIVKMANHSVVSYTEGEEALDALKRETFDLILMDVELAGVISGLEVVRQLRTHGLKTPIIAVTAYAMMGDRDKCLQAGCDDYLPKPLPITDFIQLLARFDAITKQRSISAALSTSTVPAVGTIAAPPPDPDATSPVPVVAEPAPTLAAAAAPPSVSTPAPAAAAPPPAPMPVPTPSASEIAPKVQSDASAEPVAPVAVPVSSPAPSSASAATAPTSSSSGHSSVTPPAPVPTQPPPVVNNTSTPSEPPQPNTNSGSSRETSP